MEVIPKNSIFISLTLEANLQVARLGDERLHLVGVERLACFLIGLLEPIVSTSHAVGTINGIII